MTPITERADGLLVRVRVQPRASRDEVAGVHEGRLRIRLTAPPVENAANEACGRVLAELFEVPRGRVSLTGGRKARAKTFFVHGDPAALAATFARYV